MVKLEKIIRFFRKSIRYEKLKTKEEKLIFDREVNFINLQRLRNVAFVALVICILNLIFDFSSTNIWNEKTVRHFIILDFSLLALLLFILYFTVLRMPGSVNKITPFHSFAFNFSVLYFMIWAAIVSANEWQTAKGMPTFIIGVFIICSIFIHNRLYILITLSTGLITLFISLLILGVNYIEIMQRYFSSVFLVVFAFTISRILLVNNVKTFAAKFELKKINNSLDELIKLRTRELTDTNKKLKVEISERARYEKQLQKEKERAEEADRLKSSFLANMSHEIRTPLNGIVGFADLLQLPELPDAKRYRYSTIIKKNSQQLLKIIDDIIDISMIESNQLKLNYSTTTIRHIIEASIDFFNAYKKSFKNQNVKFENINLLPDKDIEMCTDPTRVQQVIYNLLNNALKFTEKGYIRLISRLDEDEVLFTIEDTGIGIEPEKSQIIFERFVQVNEPNSKMQRGTGLGLSISSGIVHSLNGRLWLDYSYRNGSRFCFTIPINQPFRKAGNPRNILLKKKSCAKKNILIIAPSIEEFTYYRNLFPSGKISFEKEISKNKMTGFNFVLMVNVSNDMLNNNTLRAIKNGTPLFLISESPETLEKANQTGFSNCYPHPVNINKLIRDIQFVFNQKAK